MAEKELNLLKFASFKMAELGTGFPQVVESQVFRDLFGRPVANQLPNHVSEVPRTVLSMTKRKLVSHWQNHIRVFLGRFQHGGDKSRCNDP